LSVFASIFRMLVIVDSANTNKEKPGSKPGFSLIRIPLFRVCTR
jgi:hypothetical protein